MGTRLTADDIQALEGIQNAPAFGFSTSTLPDTAKRLVELGFVRHGIGDHPSITENGREALFLRRCLNELIAFAADPKMIMQLECETWLCKSGYVQRKSTKDQIHFFDFEITQNGWGWIAGFGGGDR